MGTVLKSPKDSDKTVSMVRSSFVAPSLSLVIPQDQFLITNIAKVNDQIAFGWHPGTNQGPYQIWAKANLTSGWTQSGNPTMVNPVTFYPGTNSFWKVQANLELFWATNSSQPRLTWVVPDIDMSDTLQTYTLQRRTDAPPAGQSISDNTGWTTIATPTNTATAYTDTDPVPSSGFWYRLKQTTANGVVIPYPVQPVMGGTNPPANPGTVVWSKVIFGPAYQKNVKSQAIATDSSGNVFIAGFYAPRDNSRTYPVDFGGQSLTNNSENIQFFVAKYDSNKNLLWVKGATAGGGFSVVQSVAVNSDGNVCIGGYYSIGGFSYDGTDFTSAGQDNMFLFLLSGSNGSTIWLKSFGGTGSDQIRSVVADSSGSFIFTGTFANSVDFGGTTLTSNGNTDICLVKINKSNGATLFALGYGGTGSEVVRSMTINSDNTLLISGDASGTYNLGGGNLSPIGSQDLFVAKYNSDGTYSAATRFGVPGGLLYGYGVARDANNNAILTGAFMGTVNFGTGDLTALAGHAACIVKFNPGLTSTLWSHGYGGTSGGSDYLTSSAVDTSGNIYSTGVIVGSAVWGNDFLLGATPDIVIIKHNANGQAQWSRRYVESQFVDEGLGIVAYQGSQQAIYAVGYFNGEVSFGPGQSYSGTYNAFNGCILKFEQ